LGTQNPCNMEMRFEMPTMVEVIFTGNSIVRRFIICRSVSTQSVSKGALQSFALCEIKSSEQDSAHETKPMSDRLAIFVIVIAIYSSKFVSTQRNIPLNSVIGTKARWSIRKA